ncbi:MAG: NUDIX domain-containing protein [Vicingaceae bacterium]|nr:NUDIX domain-containing protein [Vicingaceae bacterium]
MYKVFVNEKVICFTNNEENCNQFEHKLVLHFFSKEYIPFLLLMLNGTGQTNVVFVVEDYDLAFEEFQQYFKIIKAAGGIVKNNNNQKLFIYRLEKWDLPKGKIEEGEEIKEAAIREIEEECGITDLTIQNQLQDTYHVYEFKGEIILKQTYWFDLTSNFIGELVPQLEEDITKVEWLTHSEIESKVLSNTYASIKELL